jgi:hypothetical protein
LCNCSNGDKQRVAQDLSFVVELKVFFKKIPWLSTGASSPSFLSLVSFASFFSRPQSGILCLQMESLIVLEGFFFCVVEGGEATIEEKERGRGQG